MSASDPEQWSDSDYSALSRAIWRESENTKNRVRTGPAETVLSHAQAVLLHFFLLCGSASNEFKPSTERQDGKAKRKGTDTPSHIHMSHG